MSSTDNTGQCRDRLGPALGLAALAATGAGLALFSVSASVQLVATVLAVLAAATAFHLIKE